MITWKHTRPLAVVVCCMHILALHGCQSSDDRSAGRNGDPWVRSTAESVPVNNSMPDVPMFVGYRYGIRVWIRRGSKWTDISAAELQARRKEISIGSTLRYVLWGKRSVVFETLGDIVRSLASSDPATVEKKLWDCAGQDDAVTGCWSNLAARLAQEKATADEYMHADFTVSASGEANAIRLGIRLTNLRSEGGVYTQCEPTSTDLEKVRKLIDVKGREIEFHATCDEPSPSTYRSFPQGSPTKPEGRDVQFLTTPIGVLGGRWNNPGTGPRPHGFVAYGIGLVEYRGGLDVLSTTSYDDWMERWVIDRLIWR